MLSILVIQLIFLCITKVVMVNNVSVSRCPEVEIACRCGSQPPYETKLIPVHYWQFHNRNMDCIHVYLHLCGRINCSYHGRSRYPGTIYENRQIRETVSSKESSAYPIRVIYPPLDEAENVEPKTRLRRLPKTCSDSIEPLEHTTLNCTFEPEFVSCKVYCSYGYAMEENGTFVVKTNRSCREADLYWYPEAGFPTCKPYFNCQANLVKLGYLYCKTSGPVISYCDISCLSDESHDEVPEKRYNCTDGNYAKTLPYCAAIDENVMLIKPPDFKILEWQNEIF